MVFVTFDRDVRVGNGVVTLGAPDRLAGCLDALRDHVSRRHADHRGSVFEIHIFEPALGPEPLVWAYAGRSSEPISGRPGGGGGVTLPGCPPS